MLALLLPLVLIAAACLLDRLERRVVADPPAARTPVARPVAGGDGPDAPVAPVVPLRGGPPLDAATLRLPRAS